MTAVTQDHDQLVDAVLYPMASIKVGKRLRSANPDKVQSLADSIKANGLLQPIGLDDRGKLLYGLHRYEAVKSLKHSHIPAIIHTLDSKAAAELIEIDENLIRNELTELEQAVQLARRKEVYTALYGSSHGGDRKSSSYQDDSSKPKSFVEDTAQATGISKPTVHRKVALGTALADVAEELAQTDIADNQAELTALAKVTDVEQRTAIIALLRAGEADTVKEAQKLIKKHQVKKANDAAAMPVTQPAPLEAKEGCWYKLGAHYLYCGSSSGDADHFWLDPTSAPIELPATLNNAGYTLCFADPPYNAGAAAWDHSFKWAHDYLSDVAIHTVVTPGVARLQAFLRETHMPYRWLTGYYVTNGMAVGALGFSNYTPAPYFSNEERIHRNMQDCIAVTVNNAENDDTAHKGRKPMAYLLHLLHSFTAKGDPVLDPFSGSGQMILACEQLGRICVAAELNPVTATAIIARYKEVTGNEVTAL